MTITRRTLILTSVSAAGLAACGGGDDGPGTIDVTATMGAGANPGPDGSDRPLTLTLVVLSATDAFSSADVVALQDPNASLGRDLLGAEQIVLPPRGSGAKSIPIPAGATALGVVAGFRNASGKVFRTTQALPSSGNVDINITVSAAGLTLS